MSHKVTTTVRSFCFGLYRSVFLSNCEKYWEFLKRNLKAKLFIKVRLKPEVPASRLRCSTSLHFSFRELSSAVYSAKVRRRDWLAGVGVGLQGEGEEGGGKERVLSPPPSFQTQAWYSQQGPWAGGPGSSALPRLLPTGK